MTEDIKIIAILNNSDNYGNCCTETKIFSRGTELEEVLLWASRGYDIKNFRSDLRITIGQ